MKKPVAYRGNNKFIFISYCHANDEIIWPIIYKLQEHFNVWYDEGIEVGKDWDKVVTNKLAISTAVIFFATKESLLSEACMDELFFVKEKKIPIIIFILYEFPFDDNFLVHFGRKQHIKLYNHSSFNETLDEIYRCDGIKTATRDTLENSDQTIDTSQKQTKEVIKENATTPEEIKIRYYGGDPIAVEGAQTIFSPVAISMKDDNPYKLNGIKLKTTNRTIIKLDSCLGSGTYGSVYTVEKRPDIVAKVFFAERLKRRVQEKIELMVSSQIGLTNKHITWPLEALYDADNNFVGYTMNNIAKKSNSCLSLTDLIKDNEFTKKLKKTELIDMAVAILRTIDRLHRENVVLGYVDINNFIIKKESLDIGKFDRFYIGSSESFQVDRFPCRKLPKYKSAFPPEFNEARVKNYYLEYSWDYFATFILLYQMFFRKTCPYFSNFITTKNPIELTKEGKFPLSLNAKETNKNVKPEVAHIWSHLPSYIKKMFINSGKKGEANYYPGNRYNEKDWIEALLRYKEDIVNGILKSVDDEYNVAYPETEIDYNLVNYN